MAIYRRPTIFAAIAFTSCAVFVIQQRQPSDQDRVVYQSYDDTSDPIDIPLNIIVPPVPDISAVPATAISQKFAPRDLVRLKASLDRLKDECEYPRPFSVKFIQPAATSRDREVAANAGVVIPSGDPSDFEMLINVPARPGEFEMRVSWGGSNTDYISKGKIVVRSTR